MSSSLSWLVIRNNNSFLVKRRNISKPFSKEPANLTNLNSFRYNGLVHAKSLALSDTADKKGFTVVYRKRGGGGRRRPATSAVKRTFKGGPRRSLYKLRRFIRFSKYRTDLTKAALRRASALLRAQRPLKPKKTKPAAVASE